MPFKDDLVDELWENKPQRIFNKLYSIEDESLYFYYEKNLEDYNDLLINNRVTEKTKIISLGYKEKLKKVRDLIKDNEILLISELDTIAWLFNLRSSDIKYNPVFYSYVALTKKECKLFINDTIKLEEVEVLKYQKFESFMKEIKHGVVFSGSCNAYIASQFPEGRFIDDVRKLQSIKGQEEIEGFNLAYILDGIALTKLFEFIENNFESLTEKGVSNKLNELKTHFLGYMGPSFTTIAGVGENSAVVHYEAGEKKLELNMPVLIDSGSNYIFGTTDTTRTLFIGEPSFEFRKNFTRVLKGQLRAMCGTYPCGISGNIIDGLTRLDLWNEKLEYGHASGHGVGHFLCVHESPPVLSPNYIEKINPSQIFSIEPGYYKDGEYGIRIENLVLSEDVGEGFMKFRNITYVPYQLNLIDIDLLTFEEVALINKLSKEIRRVLERFLKDEEGYDYLIKNTRELIK